MIIILNKFAICKRAMDHFQFGFVLQTKAIEIFFGWISLYLGLVKPDPES